MTASSVVILRGFSFIGLNDCLPDPLLTWHLIQRRRWRKPRQWPRIIRERSAPAITYGHSKAHRPDLKQLLFILTMTADGHVPVAFRCTDGNLTDSRTHIETWNTLRTVAGRADFLYVAVSKHCLPLKAVPPVAPAGWQLKEAFHKPEGIAPPSSTLDLF